MAPSPKLDALRLKKIPITEHRDNIAKNIEEDLPFIITHRGESVAAVWDIPTMESLLEAVDVVEVTDGSQEATLAEQGYQPLVGDEAAPESADLPEEEPIQPVQEEDDQPDPPTEETPVEAEPASEPEDLPIPDPITEPAEPIQCQLERIKEQSTCVQAASKLIRLSDPNPKTGQPYPEVSFCDYHLGQLDKAGFSYEVLGPPQTVT